MNHSACNLYAVVYLARARRGRLPPHPTETTTAFIIATQKAPYPYDVGDDPSFFCSKFHGGPVTWGVCRPDVRCAIRSGDWVVFFSAEKDSASERETFYKLVAALRVKEKVDHTELFATTSRCSQYLNLLIRPKGTGWEHYEPLFDDQHPDGHYEDWLWRACRSVGLRKYDVGTAAKRHVPGSPLMIDGVPAPRPRNYIIFSETESLIASNPPLVAVHRKGNPGETWRDDSQSRQIRKLVFNDAPRALRTRNVQQPHRHFRRNLADATSWVESLRQVLAKRSQF